MNYLSNAYHYCEGDLKIRVFAEQKEDVVRINVFNTGRQLDEEEQKRVWDKFYKADKARSREYGGTGIGLSVVKASMSSLKMAYGCYNNDDGITFYFELPTKQIKCPVLIVPGAFFMSNKKTPFKGVMPAAGLEPARCCQQQILSLPRLPFRHAGLSTRQKEYYHKQAPDASVYCMNQGLFLSTEIIC